MDLFKEREKAAKGTPVSLVETLDNLKYNHDGLIPVVAQQYDSGEVVMLAWMNRAAIEETLETARVCYWSRSRQSFWRKGESSGQIQQLMEMRFDCDGDALLLKVNQTGPACHTGRRSCFYHKVVNGSVIIDSEALIDPKELYK